MHIEDLRKFAMYWLLKTQEVRADKEHYGKELTGDIYESGWISEMYGYSFGAAEVQTPLLIQNSSNARETLSLSNKILTFYI